MILLDVNILVYIHRRDTPQHKICYNWLQKVFKNQEAFGLCDVVLSGFLRIVTHPCIFKKPSKFSDANIFIEQLQTQNHCVKVAPGKCHWNIFIDLCRSVRALGNIIPDAYIAALAMESGDELITADKDFARFPNLKWRNPCAS